MFQVRDWAVTRCPGCGLIMTGSGFEEGQYETDSYYTLRFERAEDVYFEWGFRWRWILSQVARLIETPGASLDVGAGNGLFVKIAGEEFGWQARGLELSQAEVDYALRVLGVTIERQALEEVDGAFDLITSFNVLEHVVDPLGLVGAMRDKLNPGGLMVVTTPNPGCIQARLKGLKGWGMISPPHHINIFSRDSLELTLEKSGLEVLSYDTLSTYISAFRRIEPKGTTLRGMAFETLRRAGLGADHMVIARRR
jgi:2-polyprenyl-3-methyl-5-hydroxy-6-metoxy-1,4-benzoquinol methylase